MFHVFQQFLAPSKIHQISASFQNLQKSQKPEPECKMDAFLLICNVILVIIFGRFSRHA